MTWRELASCRGRRDIDWFPAPTDTRALARCQAVCFGCPVKEECADHAHVTPEYYGVWAGVHHERPWRQRRSAAGALRRLEVVR